MWQVRAKAVIESGTVLNPQSIKILAKESSPFACTLLIWYFIMVNTHTIAKIIGNLAIGTENCGVPAVSNLIGPLLHIVFLLFLGNGAKSIVLEACLAAT